MRFRMYFGAGVASLVMLVVFDRTWGPFIRWCSTITSKVLSRFEPDRDPVSPAVLDAFCRMEAEEAYEALEAQDPGLSDWQMLPILRHFFGNGMRFKATDEMKTRYVDFCKENGGYPLWIESDESYLLHGRVLVTLYFGPLYALVVRRSRYPIWWAVLFFIPIANVVFLAKLIKDAGFHPINIFMASCFPFSFIALPYLAFVRWPSASQPAELRLAVGR